MNASSSPVRRLAAALLSAVVAVGLVAAGGSLVPASAAPALSHVQGTVSGPAASGTVGPVRDVDVVLVAVTTSTDGSGTNYEYVDDVTTSATGGYSFTVEAGTYRVCFTDGSGTFLDECNRDKADVTTADDVVVGLAQTATVDAQLARAGHLAGTVSAAFGVASGVSVTAFDLEGGDWFPAGFDESDANGRYDVGGLVAGTYRLCFQDDDGVLAPECYDDQPDLGSAKDVPLTSGATVSGLDARLGPAAHVTGRVTGPGGAVLRGVAVAAYSFVDGSWEPVRYAATLTDGTYHLDGLRAGTYRVCFRDDGHGTVIPECYADAATVQTATDVVVAAGATRSGIDAELAAAGHVTGTVRGPGGPLDGVLVYAATYVGGRVETQSITTTDDDGTYDLGGLATGRYRVCFSSGDAVLASECWDDQTSIATAADIPVTAGATTPGHDATLAPGGHVTGTVTVPTGAPGGSLEVDAYVATGTTYTFVAAAGVEDDGTYDLAGLRSGTYRICFYDYEGTSAQECYDDVARVDQGRDVTVTAPGTTARIDATLGRGAHVTGRLTTPTGASAGDVEVDLYTLVGGTYQLYDYFSTGPDGRYDAGGLGAGTYRLCFTDPSGRLADECYDDVASVTAARDVPVAAGATLSGYDARLAARPASGAGSPTSGPATGPATSPATSPGAAMPTAASTSTACATAQRAEAAAVTTYAAARSGAAARHRAVKRLEKRHAPKSRVRKARARAHAAARVATVDRLAMGRAHAGTEAACGR